MNDLAGMITPSSLDPEYLTEKDCVFSVNKNGFLSAVIKGKEYSRVLLTRALPLTRPFEYIAVTDCDRNELGIIEKAEAYPEEQFTLIKNELSQCYFTPEITEIHSVKEKMGHFWFDVEIGGFKKNFTVRDITKSVRRIGSGIIITDMDGNRYSITDFDNVSKKTRRVIAPYIY